jgi:opacity protein-like surface antigen
MKKILALSVILVVALSAAAFSQPAKKAVTQTATIRVVNPPSAAPKMPISVKAGLAGGAGRLGVVLDRQVNAKTAFVGEIGYAVGNAYSILTAGVGGVMTLRENLAVGLEVTYSSYSEKVKLSLPTMDITEKSGVGGELFVKLTRDKLYGQLGYDTRLGGVAEVGLVVRM